METKTSRNQDNYKKVINIYSETQLLKVDDVLQYMYDCAVSVGAYSDMENIMKVQTIVQDCINFGA